MFITTKELAGFALQSGSENIGKVKDVLFDDKDWGVRYLMVDTGNWLPGRKVLISPQSAHEPDIENKVIPVALRRDQIENSPGIDEDAPVSRQHEKEVAVYYNWTPYWGLVGTGGVPVVTAGPFPGNVMNEPTPADNPSQPEEAEQVAKEAAEPGLRSATEIADYHIQAQDERIGHVETFLVDTETWRVRYLIVDTGNWLSGRKVLVALDWIKDIDWHKSQMYVALTSEQIKNGPEYDENQPVSRDYEMSLYNHYGFPFPGV